jgi:hypothetical protein
MLNRYFDWKNKVDDKAKAALTRAFIKVGSKIPNANDTIGRAMANTPKLDVAKNIQNPVGRFAGTIAQETINIPSKIMRNVGQTGRDISSGKIYTPQGARQFAGRTGENILDVVTMGKGKLAYNTGKSAFSKGIKRVGQEFVRGGKQGLITGAKLGVGYGTALEAQKDQTSLRDIAKQGAIGGATGGIAGGLLGGALTGTGSIRGAFKADRRAGMKPMEILGDVSGRMPAGLSIKNVSPYKHQKVDGKSLRYIKSKTDEQDPALIQHFLDYVYEKKPGKKVDPQLEIRVRDVADEMGIYSDVSNRRLANKLGKVLDYIAEPKKDYTKTPLDEIIGRPSNTSQVIEELGKNLPRFGMNIQDVSGGKPSVLQIPTQRANPYTKFIRSGEKSLRQQGEAGQELVDIMRRTELEGDLGGGMAKGQVNKMLQGLKKEEALNLTDVLEGKSQPLTDKVASVAKEMRSFLDTYQKRAKESGLSTGYRENYFPRIYNFGDDFSKKNKEKAILNLVETGQAKTRVEAEKFLNDFIFKNRERKAGNLEYERLFDIEGYEKNPEKAISLYVDMAEKRLAEVKNLGKKDELPSTLINKIAEEGGDHKQAQMIFDYMFKGEDRNALTSALLQYNTITKLSLSFITNITQNISTAAKGGVLNTVKGAAQAVAQGINAIKGKKYDDVAYIAGALDDAIMKQEMGVSSKLTNAVMYIFQKVENFNRRTAANTGVLRAKQLAEKLTKDPQSNFAARQLKTLGLNIEDIVEGKLTEKQLLTAANKMVQSTQFRINSLNVPELWRTPLGKVLSQYKTFSFMQTKFIRDEILKEAKHGNLAPLARFIVLAPIASYAAMSVRNAINANESEKSQPGIRNLDMYRKAIGDLPSDVVAQMQYALEQKDKFYTTPIRNVKNFSSPLIGPTGSDIMELISSLEKMGSTKRTNETFYKDKPLAQSDPAQDIKRFGVSKIPFVGRRLTNEFLAYEPTEAKNLREQAKQALITNDNEKLKEIIQKDPSLANKTVLKNLMKEAMLERLDPKEKQMYDEIKNKQKKQYYE